MTRVVWSPKSIRDLDAIHDYVAQFNPVAAKRLIQKIVQRTDRLLRFPLSGGVVPEDDFSVYRQVLHGNYRVIYRHQAEQAVVRIITVTHAARLLDPERLNEDSP